MSTKAVFFLVVVIALLASTSAQFPFMGGQEGGGGGPGGPGGGLGGGPGGGPGGAGGGPGGPGGGLGGGFNLLAIPQQFIGKATQMIPGFGRRR